MTRRDFVSTAAAGASAASLADSAQQQEPNPQSANTSLVQLASGDMIVGFDRTLGVMHSVQCKSDPLKTNFIGNAENVRRVLPNDSRRLGDIITTVWAVADPNRLETDLTGRTNQTAGAWRPEWTGASGDIRNVQFDGTRLEVEYLGKSKNENGLRSFDLQMSYTFGEEGRLVWDLQIKNTTASALEIGELAFPFLLNDDYGAYGTK